MADKNIQITQRNEDNTAWDNAYPKTKASNVIADDGIDLEVQLAQIPKFQTAQGTATAIILTGIPLTDGYSKTFVVANDNGGSATTANGKNLYKPNTTISPNLTKGKAVTIWYDLAKTCFFIKASAEGNTIAAHVLAADTFSNDNDTGLIGTMPNKGAVTQALAVNGAYTIPAGYHNGLGVVNQSVTTKAAATFNPSTVAQTIAANQYLNGVQTIAAITGSASVGQVLSGYTFNSGNGIGLTGNIPSKVASTISPSTVAQTIPAGQYLSGIQTIAATTGSASLAQVLAGYTFNSAYGIGLTGNATISNLGGKQCANGYCATPATDTVTFNLGFTPAIVVMTKVSSGSRYLSVTSNDSALLNLQYFCCVKGGSTYYNETTHYNGVVIISGGFTAAVMTTGYSYWYAIGA